MTEGLLANRPLRQVPVPEEVTREDEDEAIMCSDPLNSNPAPLIPATIFPPAFARGFPELLSSCCCNTQGQPGQNCRMCEGENSRAGAKE